jgi:hypothetical protein
MCSSYTQRKLLEKVVTKNNVRCVGAVIDLAVTNTVHADVVCRREKKVFEGHADDQVSKGEIEGLVGFSFFASAKA